MKEFNAGCLWDPRAFLVQAVTSALSPRRVGASKELAGHVLPAASSGPAEQRDQPPRLRGGEADGNDLAPDVGLLQGSEQLGSKS